MFQIQNLEEYQGGWQTVLSMCFFALALCFLAIAMRARKHGNNYGFNSTILTSFLLFLFGLIIKGLIPTQ